MISAHFLPGYFCSRRRLLNGIFDNRRLLFGRVNGLLATGLGDLSFFRLIILWSGCDLAGLCFCDLADSIEELLVLNRMSHTSGKFSALFEKLDFAYLMSVIDPHFP